MPVFGTPAGNYRAVKYRPTQPRTMFAPGYAFAPTYATGHGYGPAPQIPAHGFVAMVPHYGPFSPARPLNVPPAVEEGIGRSVDQERRVGSRSSSATPGWVTATSVPAGTSTPPARTPRPDSPWSSHQQYGEVTGSPVQGLASIAWVISYPLVETQNFDSGNGNNYTITDGPATQPPTEELYLDLPEYLSQYQERWGPIRVVGSESTITSKDLLDAIDKYFLVSLQVALLSQRQREGLEVVHAMRVARVQHLGDRPELSEIRRLDGLHSFSFFYIWIGTVRDGFVGETLLQGDVRPCGWDTLGWTVLGSCCVV
ncbi:hypothetical protein C8R44DRAFT_865868 [Mycena epipterygia]|nr:hypothetical protein C8R44DRAFT_865868 [Mycena epipterygia]